MVEVAHRQPSWMGIKVKDLALFALAVQNAAVIMFVRYSRTMPPVGGQRYFSSTAVFLTEMIKFALCLTIALYDVSRNLPPTSSVLSLFKVLSGAVFTGDSWKLAIPAIIFTLQNSLQYIALSHLDAPTAQITYQLKLAFTAIFGILAFRKPLSLRNWAMLGLLMLGVAVTYIPSADPTGFSFAKEVHARRSITKSLARDTVDFTKRSATYEGIQEDEGLEHPPVYASLGLLAALGSCCLSGLAGVILERIFKDSKSPSSLWVRNIQLSFYSLFPALFIGVIFIDGEEVAKVGVFQGYNWVVWTTIGLQALGGVLVAICVFYADNLAKTTATSISVILTIVASVLFFDFPVTTKLLVGAILSVIAANLFKGKDRSRPPPIKIAKYESTTIDRRPSIIAGEQDPNTLPLPTALQTEEARSTSRPSSPRGHSRGPQGKGKSPKRSA
ncbi:udp-galactose transporter [Xylona heveae TC161]|uniref:Udp-galactose transporter n=1 Tax=Xylona heveae (strain CBS 132557 / TC161) TaxID=1328760 RepID=A0A165IHR3_XYLHT|nr:udp-galactose transporter [Xylona heveae TC161]KZF24915.1 udp-galactose transporter [Xylona heveae TC161]